MLLDFTEIIHISIVLVLLNDKDGVRFIYLIQVLNYNVRVLSISLIRKSELELSLLEDLGLGLAVILVLL